MSAILKITPVAMRQSRLMATAVAAQSNDPIQKIFLDRVKEFKNSNKGLDENHRKLLESENERLKRVYQISNENQITQMNYKFDNEVEVSLRDLDEKKSGAVKTVQTTTKKDDENYSSLLATIPVHHTDEFHLPYPARPDITMLIVPLDGDYAPAVPTIEGTVPIDENTNLEKMTPHKLQRELRVMFGKDMPTIDDDNNPQRDTKNFPRIAQNNDTPPTRLHILPESWFNNLYPKIGISGPYTLLLGFLATALSKEWIVYEHNLLSGISMFAICAYALPKFGPKIRDLIDRNTRKENDDWTKWQEDHISLLGEIKSIYNNELQKGSLIDEIHDVRKHDVENQLVLEHRSRIHQIYKDTKRKLDYLVSKADTERSIAQKNMVNWVIDNSLKSIGTKQEGEVLDSCISSLKSMSVKHANAI